MAANCRVRQVVGSDTSEPEAQHAQSPASGPVYVPFTYTQVIHSGHFMVSSPHRDASPGGLKGGRCPRYDFDTVNRTWCQTYRYGPFSSGSLSIDPTLTRLFECMSLAYSGKIVSPKWKSFKGLRLLWRDKIRLNNAIWRAWFIQYVEKRKNPVCGFVTPLEGSEADAHRKPEAIVLEGSYWKRRIEVVIKEYHKWRIYYKKRLQKEKDGILSMLQEGQICQAKLEKWSSQLYPEPEATPEEAHMFDMDYLLSDISDTLFTMTQKQCPWASSEWHNTYTTNADMIQPGLTPLQPNLDDFMDIPDIFMNAGVQPCDQSGFAASDYDESSSNTALAPVATLHAAPHLFIDTHISQAALSSDNWPQATSSKSQTEGSGLNQHCSGYHSTTAAFRPQSYTDPVVPASFPANVEQVFSAAVPLFSPFPCHKFGYHATASTTPTVITHTASTVDSTQQGHRYPHPEDTNPQAPCPSLVYMSDPVHAAQPPVGTIHRFAVPEQVSTTDVRGKHKQKKGGERPFGPPVGLSYASSTAPMSCLAKLLSTGKPSVGFETTYVTVEGQKLPSSSASASSSGHVERASSQVLHGAVWHGVTQTLRNQSSAQGQSRTSKCSTAPALLTDDTAHTSTTLLIPKTEKLSPVQLYGTDRSILTGLPRQTSPPTLLEKSSNPESSHSGFLGYGMIEMSKHTESRRITHISAEQKRRFNIKLGFDTLHNLVTTLSSQPSIKISKATTLQKTAEYIGKMQQEKTLLHEEAQRLRDEIQILNSAINACQQQLPAAGVPITWQRFDHMRQKFREYVQAQTLQNWKFWIFSIIIEPLFESYNGMVSTASVEQLCQSTLSWLDQHCSLPSLRPMVLSSLRLLSTTTSILTDPSLLPEQATLAVTQDEPPTTLDHSIHHPSQDNIGNM
ncbi:carbohydrate-responsive element-binding protein-like [Hippocampus zosterae]|uniref:carbohydrate-responsive element-binding protein-like n=1 Tax=Hippocampus zosterae TaxID=109293 RepID=UPI00223E2399|nr:carbohydrate-responsive element-binding protein-like [Hippocampus zosterae]